MKANELINYANKQYSKGVNDAIDKILHQYIDNPIKGDITKEKLKAANIVGIIRTKFKAPPQIEQLEDRVRLTFDSGIIGIRQGDVLITVNGQRFQLLNKSLPSEWEEQRFIYD